MRPHKHCLPLSEEDVPSFNTTGNLLSVGRHPTQSVRCRSNEQLVSCHYKRVRSRSVDRHNASPTNTVLYCVVSFDLCSLCPSVVPCFVLVRLAVRIIGASDGYGTVRYSNVIVRCRASPVSWCTPSYGYVVYRSVSCLSCFVDDSWSAVQSCWVVSRNVGYFRCYAEA